jgi:hypothetical protein
MGLCLPRVVNEGPNSAARVGDIVSYSVSDSLIPLNSAIAYECVRFTWPKNGDPEQVFSPSGTLSRALRRANSVEERPPLLI